MKNAFGILANRFQCLLAMLQMGPVAAKTLVMAYRTRHWIVRVRTTTLFVGHGAMRVY